MAEGSCQKRTGTFKAGTRDQPDQVHGVARAGQGGEHGLVFPDSPPSVKQKLKARESPGHSDSAPGLDSGEDETRTFLRIPFGL
jgi:hypothetical protein